MSWPNLGYADAYQESFETFRRLRTEGLPTTSGSKCSTRLRSPSVAAWVTPEDQDRVELSYERALLADLDRLLTALPHAEIAVQWDVAVEFGLLVGGFPAGASHTFDRIVERLVRCADRVPADVPVGLHLCYGDYQHHHFKEPESLELQVQVANAVSAGARRLVNWFSFTVPQYQREASFFAPLGDLQTDDETELYFALVPYHRAEQEPGTTGEQVRLVDHYLGRDNWGICTECGMARAEPDEIPVLLDQHREILDQFST